MTVNDVLNLAWPLICGIAALAALWLSARLYPATRKVEAKIEQPSTQRSAQPRLPR